jgi:DNA-binding NarL/FixJ family response regulator
MNRGTFGYVSSGARDPIVLTEREWEIVRRVSQGESNDEIAHALCIGAATLRTHLGQIYAKLGLHNTAQLANWHEARHADAAPGDAI